jgi:hypothetical protein
MKKLLTAAILLLAFCGTAFAGEAVITLNEVKYDGSTVEIAPPTFENLKIKLETVSAGTRVSLRFLCENAASAEVDYHLTQPSTTGYFDSTDQGSYHLPDGLVQTFGYTLAAGQTITFEVSADDAAGETTTYGPIVSTAPAEGGTGPGGDIPPIKPPTGGGDGGGGGGCNAGIFSFAAAALGLCLLKRS